MVVVGGGVAGIAAALRGIDAGCAVTLVEARSRLGGAAGSFRRGDLTVDTGQHVILRCYSTYRRLLARLGVADAVPVQERLGFPVLHPARRPVWLRRSSVPWLPAPAHLLPVVLGHRLLAPAARLRVLGTALALRALDPEDPRLDGCSFGAWLRHRGESDRSIEALWGLLTLAALNAQVDDASLALAVRVFRTGLLDGVDGGDIGVPTRPLGQLHHDAAHRALRRGGANVRLRAKVSGLHRVGDRWRVETPDEVVDADGVVVAVPHAQAARLLHDLPVPACAQWARLGSSPIVNVHVVYDRPVTELPFAAVVGSPVQWVFDRTAVAGARAGRQYLAVSLSAADRYLQARTGELRHVFLPALAALFPRAAGARVEDFFVTREPCATFRQAPGTRRLRPPPATGLPGLALAGAWAGTGWPDTLEGAARSGEAAADHLIQHTLHRSSNPVEAT
ncbi:MAG: hydroxysqualene dehydroxylase HpnE [Pseudonocardia sp.]|nr:hydroxysqualene dehydroxylase HpnE [Pseudonocardia sp.]